MKSTEWIGVDLDGTLAHYDKWVGVHHIGEPVPAMLARVRQWRDAGIRVKIFTARVSDGKPETRRYIEEWCLVHLGEVLEVTNIKDYAMLELWDDRAVSVEKNTGRVIGGESRVH